MTQQPEMRLAELCAGWSSPEAAEKANAVVLVKVADVLRVLAALKASEPTA